MSRRVVIHATLLRALRPRPALGIVRCFACRCIGGRRLRHSCRSLAAATDVLVTVRLCQSVRSSRQSAEAGSPGLRMALYPRGAVPRPRPGFVRSSRRPAEAGQSGIRIVSHLCTAVPRPRPGFVARGTVSCFACKDCVGRLCAFPCCKRTLYPSCVWDNCVHFPAAILTTCCHPNVVASCTQMWWATYVVICCTQMWWATRPVT